jgi:NYN domain
MLPQNQINEIKYFTALVSARPRDPDQPVRQQAYLRALETLPNIKIIYGHFLTSKVDMPLANPSPNGPRTARVIKTEEKGSDVNLAVHLLSDAYQKLFEMAVVISNDSDLLEPVKIIRNQLGIPVGVLNPQFGKFDSGTGTYNKKHSHPSQVLKKHATFFKPIREGVLAGSQFLPVLVDGNGTFHKPSSW